VIPMNGFLTALQDTMETNQDLQEWEKVAAVQAWLLCQLKQLGPEALAEICAHSLYLASLMQEQPA
jgi:hypothetical protein